MVGVALVASWLAAVLFTPYLGYRLLQQRDRGGKTRDEQAIYSTRFCRGLPSATSNPNSRSCAQASFCARSICRRSAAGA